MDYLNYLTLFAALANIILGLLVFLRNPKKALYISFGLFSLNTGLWCLSNFVFYFFPKMFLFESQYALGASTIVAIIIWFNFLRNKATKLNVIIFTLVYLFTLLIPLMGSLVIKSLSVTSNGAFTFVPGPLFDYYGYLINILFAYYIGIVVYTFVKSKGSLKRQYGYILIGSFIFGGVSVMFSSILPMFGIKMVAPIDAQSSLFLVAASSYAIAKHKLMDIRLVVARSVSYLLLLLSLAAFYAGSVLGLEKLFFPEQLANFGWGEGALRTVIAVVMVFLFQPLKTWITKVTDKVFFRNAYNADDLLSELSNTLGSTIVLIELLYKVGDLLSKNIKASRVLFALVKDDSRLYTAQAIGYKQTPDVDPKDVIKMTHDGIIHFDDLEDGSRMKHLLSEYEATLVVPLKTEKEIVGVLLLGEKSSGDMYSQQDISVLEILAPELAIAVENAKSYEEISRFNTTLRQEVKRATYRLKQKNEQLMELDHAKDEFISMASHQLRTPLTAIKGYLSMLLEGDAGDIKVSQYDFINEAYSGANRMVGLINDLLNVSRMDTGRFFLEPKEVDIERVVNEEVKQLSNSAKAKGLYLKLEVKGKVPHIYADETKIRQVVMNFMDNAIYYTNTGGVTVILKHDKDNFIYEVHDTGIGVPKAQRDHLFEKFFRADNARTARPDGTGLGIYLAKRVVLDHGGEIIFDSTEGKGSVFGFKFPLKKKASPKLASAPAPRPEGTVASMPTATEIAERSNGAEMTNTKE